MCVSAVPEHYTYVSCTLPLDQLDTVHPGMIVRFAGEQGRINSLFTNEDKVGYIIEMDNENIPLKDGEYDAQLVLESTTPVSFLWN